MNIYKINETLQHSYYQMPQELFENKKYKKLSIEAKVIYAFLLNRMNLSRINKWINDKGEIYLIYTRKEIQSKLNLSDKPVTRAFKELRETNLIKEEKQGFWKPNLIYIGKIEHEELQNSNINTNDYRETNDVLIDNRVKEDYCVEENTIQETEYLRANKKENIKHKNNNIDVSQSEREAKNLEDIKQKCELYLFKESQIHNSTNFMISCLYNAITEYYSDSDLQFKIDYGSG